MFIVLVTREEAPELPYLFRDLDHAAALFFRLTQKERVEERDDLQFEPEGTLRVSRGDLVTVHLFEVQVARS